MAEPVAQPITLQNFRLSHHLDERVQPPANENNEGFKKPASEPTSEEATEPGAEQAFEPASQQTSESDSLPALEAIASESSVTIE